MRHAIFGTIPVTSVTLGHSGMSRCMFAALMQSRQVRHAIMILILCRW